MQRGRGREDARRGAGVTTSHPPRPSGAIVAAGGRGARSGAALPKQFARLGGRPLFTWSLSSLSACGCRPVVLVVPDGRVELARELVGEGTPVEVVTGGATRQESVARGLEVIATPAVLVHDAARPFVEPEIVEAVLRALDSADAGIPVVPVDETIKEVDGADVVRTMDRSSLVRSQTPQAFDADVLRHAHARARAEDYHATDDAELVERYGGKVKVVRGSKSNIKLTYPEDFALAEAMIAP